MSDCESRQCTQGGAKHQHQAGEDGSHGSPSQEPEALVQRYLSGAMVSGPNVCDH